MPRGIPVGCPFSFAPRSTYGEASPVRFVNSRADEVEGGAVKELVGRVGGGASWVGELIG